MFGHTKDRTTHRPHLLNREILANTIVMSSFGKLQGSFDLLRHLSDFLAI